MLLCAAQGFETYLWPDTPYFRPPRLVDEADVARQVRNRLGPSWNFQLQSIWLECEPRVSSAPGPMTGWKIHLSAAPHSGQEVVTRAVDTLSSIETPFKIVGSTSLLRLVNAKWMSRPAAGKFVTIYPNGPEECRQLLEALRTALSGVDGPFLLSDRRYRDSSCVHYRYGAHRRMSRLDPDGMPIYLLEGPDGVLIRDDRAVGGAVPNWISDPFLDTEKPSRAGENGVSTGGDGVVIAGRFHVSAAIAFSASGGVYRGIDQTTGDPVIVKEARPWTGWDETGSDAVSRLKAEYDSLRRLEGADGFPTALALIEEWQHHFLIQTVVPGINLNHFVASHHPLLQEAPDPEQVAAYRDLLHHIWEELDRLLRVVHASGLCVGDLSTTNIMTDGQTVSLVDFESAYQSSSPKRTPCTHGFMSPTRMIGEVTPLEDDEYAAAAVKMATVLPVNGMLAMAPDRAYALALNVARGLQMETQFASLQTQLDPSLLAETPDLSSNADELRLTFERSLAGLRSSLEGDPTKTLRRLDFRSYVTNPYGVAWGIAGVLHAAHYLGESASAHARVLLSAMRNNNPAVPPGLYNGQAGIAWVLSEEERAQDLACALMERSHRARESVGYDLSGGRAGIGLAELRLWMSTGDQGQLNAAKQIGRELVGAGEECGDGLRWRAGGENEPLGYAYGSSGIGSFFLYLASADAPERQLWLDTAARALQHDLMHAVESERGLAVPGVAGGSVIYPYWGRGSGGVVRLATRIFNVTGDERILERIGALTAGTLSPYSASSGLFNGLAGVLDAATDIQQFTPLSVSRSQQMIATTLGKFSVPSEAGECFMDDRLVRLTLDFGTGTAGVLCALDRYLRNRTSFNFTLDELLHDL